MSFLEPRAQFNGILTPAKTAAVPVLRGSGTKAINAPSTMCTGQLGIPAEVPSGPSCEPPQQMSQGVVATLRAAMKVQLVKRRMICLTPLQ